MSSLSLTMVSPLAVYLDAITTASNLAQRPATLDGKVLGLLPNWRPSAIHILKSLGELLAERYKLKAIEMAQPMRELPLRAGKLDKAESDFDLAIRSAPGLAEAWINKGVVLARQPGREAEAVALISHGIELGPKEPARAFFARAQALEVAGRLKEAMDDYAAAARADPDWPAPAEELKRFRVERRKVLRG